jgi:15-cis-phytoene synthase
MQATTHTWEPTLLSLAYEANRPLADVAHFPVAELDDLSRAYEYCDALTSAHSKSFHLASSLLASPQKRAVRALYAFCRVTDDIVDRSQGDAAQQLAEWRRRSFDQQPGEGDPVLVAWADARNRYSIPLRYAEQLISGVAQDLAKFRYDTFDELAAYCYGVASTVGLMSMHIIGFSSHDAIPYAIKLGVALQLTNILRDVGEDWQRGRVYLPADELARFGLSDDDIGAGEVTEAWREFMRFQISRNRQLYAEARPGIGYLDQSGRFATTAATDLYQAILNQIEANDYDVFAQRAGTSAFQKLTRLPQIWWRARTVQTPH